MKSIKYNEGVPDFSNYLIFQMKIKGLSGTKKDFYLAYKKIVVEKIIINGNSFDTIKAIKDYFYKNELVLHHEPDYITLTVLDKKIHEMVIHGTGAINIKGN